MNSRWRMRVHVDRRTPTASLCGTYVAPMSLAYCAGRALVHGLHALLCLTIQLAQQRGVLTTIP